MSLYRHVAYPIASLVLKVVALFNPKARRGLVGRASWRSQLTPLADSDYDKLRVHVHASSVGEFEQAKPLIESLRENDSPVRITASFFSSSGFEQQSKYPSIDSACFLPRDTPAEMKAFLNAVQPHVIIFIRYDLWFQFLSEASARGIPCVLVCGTLRDDTFRLSPWFKRFFAKLYGMLSLIAAASDNDARVFKQLTSSVLIVTCGDTRYDRVLDITRSAADRVPAVLAKERFARKTILVAGSTWKADEKILAEAFRQDDQTSLVIVPHEPTDHNVQFLLSLFEGARALSALETESSDNSLPRVIVVDRTGILSALYSIADMAYVGGGHGDGVHSVLEPAAFGIPVACGPKVERSHDAKDLVHAGGLAIVESASQLKEWMGANGSRNAKSNEFVKSRAGATERIITELRKRGLLSR